MCVSGQVFYRPKTTSPGHLKLVSNWVQKPKTKPKSSWAPLGCARIRDVHHAFDANIAGAGGENKILLADTFLTQVKSLCPFVT